MGDFLANLIEVKRVREYFVTNLTDICLYAIRMRHKKNTGRHFQLKSKIKNGR